MIALAHEVVRSRPGYDGLGFEEQAILDNWLSRARHVDAVIDLSDRFWNMGIAGPILGIFRDGCDQASWLIVRSGTDWGLADCEDRSVLSAQTSLTDVLACIEAAK